MTATPSRWTSRRLTVWGTGLLLLSWFIYVHTMAVPGLVDRAGRFKGTDHIYFYVMGSLLRDGRADELYTPDSHIAEGRRRIDPSLALYAPYSNYGPQIAWVFAPLSRLPYAWSLTAFLLLTAIAYGLSVWLLWRDLPGLAPHGRLIALLAAAAPPFFTLLRYAQLSAFSLLLLSLALTALRRDRRFLAGLVLGTLIFKPQLGVIVAVALVAAAEWPILAGAAVAGAGQLLIAWTVGGTEVMSQYAGVLWTLLRNPALVQIYPTEVHSARGFLHLLLPAGPLASGISSLLVAGLVVSAVFVWRSRSETGLRWGTLILLTLLASPHLLSYDLVLLAIPVLIFADWAVTHRDHPSHQWVCIALLLAYLSPFSSNLARLWPVQSSAIVFASLAWLGASLCLEYAKPKLAAATRPHFLRSVP